MHKDAEYQAKWREWSADVVRSPQTVLFLPGIMGSELFDVARTNTIWADYQLPWEVDNLAFQALAPDGARDGQGQLVLAHSTVHPPVVADPYIAFRAAFRPGLFCYDWRDSIEIEAQRLTGFLGQLVPQLGGKKLNIVTHSMGGNVLLAALGRTDAFDAHIARIVFIAPPFRGALRPIEVIESGTGTPADILIRNTALQESAATMVGLWQLVVAPRGIWPKKAPVTAENIIHPVVSGEDLSFPASWANPYAPAMRNTILQIVDRYQRRVLPHMERLVKRMPDKLDVIVGVNGNTEYAATRTGRDWTLHSLPRPDFGRVANGDGTVLAQSSWFEGLAPTRHHVYVPSRRVATHADLPDLDGVIKAVEGLITAGQAQGLQSAAAVYPNVDWLPEMVAPKPLDNLGYLARAVHRHRVAPKLWKKHGLNPDGDDDWMFTQTRLAALRVLAGQAEPGREAERIGVGREWFEGHVRRMVLPMLG